MKYITRELKGTYGYIKKQRLFEIIKTIILFAMALGIFFIGYCTLGTKKSLWTVFAILAVLPACKALVGVIMLAMYKSLTKEEYEKYKDSVGNVRCVYENVLTTSKKSYYLPVIACADNTLVGYMDAKTSKDVRDINEHIESVLKAAGHKSATVKIFDKKDQFLTRVTQMNSNLSNNSVSDEAILSTIKAVSL